MNLPAYPIRSLLLLAVGIVATASSTAAASVDTTLIAETIKKDIAQLVAGLNAHEAMKTTAFDAPNVVSMECGSPSSVGIEADRDDLKAGFAHDAAWRVSLIRTGRTWNVRPGLARSRDAKRK